MGSSLSQTSLAKTRFKALHIVHKPSESLIPWAFVSPTPRFGSLESPEPRYIAQLETTAPAPPVSWLLLRRLHSLAQLPTSAHPRHWGLHGQRPNLVMRLRLYRLARPTADSTTHVCASGAPTSYRDSASDIVHRFAATAVRRAPAALTRLRCATLAYKTPRFPQSCRRCVCHAAPAAAPARPLGGPIRTRPEPHAAHGEGASALLAAHDDGPSSHANGRASYDVPPPPLWS
ncbi:hypothetical protein C8J57DRAFT_1625968 [Mycena rebaudengoi]|nr:hypothetical protein C8J57DRAFT_1625968 [Mycena rebaudengoi]